MDTKRPLANQSMIAAQLERFLDKQCGHAKGRGERTLDISGILPAGLIDDDASELREELHQAMRGAGKTVEVEPTELIATQRLLHYDALINHIQHPGQGGFSGAPVLVVSKGGKLYVLGGHHRAAAAVLTGRKLAVAYWDADGW